MPCKTARAKMGSQSRKGWPMPKIARKPSPMILRLSGKPKAPMSSNLAKPPWSKFMRRPKKRKPGTKPYQKRFSFVASKMPLPAKTNSSSHLRQFIRTIIAQMVLLYNSSRLGSFALV